MTWKTIPLPLAAGALLWGALAADNPSEKSHKPQTVSVRKMADSLHAVIAADRQAYSELIVQPLEAGRPRLPVSENWRDNHGLPVQAQILRHAAASIQKQGAEFSYTLRSLWPINRSDAPQTRVEEAGLEAVVKRPEQPFYREEELGGRSYFTAVYADRATLSSCVACHNRHSRSPKTDFKVGDVMGAIVVRVPLEF
jgi:Protein of unknown function (DUF3365)